MLRSFLIVPWRNLLRNSLHSTINIIGLTIGITACISILTIIRFEYSFNKHHPDIDRIYRVYTVFRGAFSGISQGVPIPLSDYLRENTTGIENVTNFHIYFAKVAITQPDGGKMNLDKQRSLIFATPNYIDLIGQYEWLAGSKSSLEQPHKVVLIESQAQKYFGSISPSEMLGKQIIYNDSLFMEVGGVVKDISYNTDFLFTDILSFSTINVTWLKEWYVGNWGNFNSSSQLFIKLSKNTQIENVIRQLDAANNKSKEKANNSNILLTFHVQPLNNLHFNTEIGVFNRTSHVANPDILKRLTMITIAILIIAIINFINLETAIYVRRLKEVGIRKILGSSRLSLTLHFLSESFLVTFIAIVLSVPFIQLSLFVFKDYFPEGVTFDLSNTSTFSLLFFAFIIVGILAGTYPAFLLSSYNSSKSLINQVKGNLFTRSLRKGLTIFQFGFSQVLMIVTIIVGIQINYMLGKDLGFTSDSIVYFYLPYNENISKQDVLKNKLIGFSDITEITKFSLPPIQNGHSMFGIKFFNDHNEEINVNVYQKGGEMSYIRFFEIDLVAGRNLRKSEAFPETLINETCALELGYKNPSNILGKQMIRNDTLTIVGVVKDFHFKSLHHRIEPLQITITKGGWALGVKLANNINQNKSIGKIKEAYLEVYPDRDFDYFFMDDTKEQFYKSEQSSLKLSITATVIAIIISCLGLFGLSSYTTIQRINEIGIRKVFGSSNKGIVVLLSKDFLKLVIIAFIIACPLAYWIGGLLLEDYAYRINPSPWIFFIVGNGSILIAFLTVSYQSIQAAMTNPSICLRYE